MVFSEKGSVASSRFLPVSPFSSITISNLNPLGNESKPNPTSDEKPRNPETSQIFISSDTLQAVLSHHTLIQHFHTSLPTVSSAIQTPIRQNYAVSPTSSLLLMPSWSSSPSLPYIGVKLVTSFPQKSTVNLPGIHANYVLISSTTGQPLTSMDGTLLNLYRTASVSGLASKILARNDSKTLVMIGAGALAPHLIKAHLAANPSLQKVIIWNRTTKKGGNWPKIYGIAASMMVSVLTATNHWRKLFNWVILSAVRRTLKCRW
ncbi:hypothetical protein SLE2022_373120 [Rubroshorea leprosula]